MSKEITKTPPIILEFLRAVIDDPERPLQKVAQHQWEMLHGRGAANRKANTLEINIMASYWLTPATLEKVGRRYHISRDRTSVVNRRTMWHLWHLSSDETKAKFPLDQIPGSKKGAKNLS